MSKALKALEVISQDDEVRQLVDAREKHRINLHIIRTEAEARGRAEGEAVGEARGKAKREYIRKAAQPGLELEKIAAIFQESFEEVSETLKFQN